MQGFLEGQVEVHGASRKRSIPPEALEPEAPEIGLGGQRLHSGRLHPPQAGSGCLAEPTAATPEEVLLVHALVSPASLEPIRPVGAEQQQGNGSMVGLHAGGQQLGHRRSGGGDHGGGHACGPGEPKGEEGGRTLIKGGVQAKSPMLEQARR